jgi:hypothetical protein
MDCLCVGIPWNVSYWRRLRAQRGRFVANHGEDRRCDQYCGPSVCSVCVVCAVCAVCVCAVCAVCVQCVCSVCAVCAV